MAVPAAISYVGVFLVLGGVMLWLLSNGFVSEQILKMWSKVLTVVDAPETRIEHIGLMYPHLPIYLLFLIHAFPGLNAAAAVPLLSVLGGATLLVLWSHHLRIKRWPFRTRTVLMILMLVNPLFLWAVTGAGLGLSLLFFYWLCFSLVRLILLQDARAVFLLSSVLAFYFFADSRVIFITFSILPLIPFVAPRRMLAESPMSVFVVILLPVFFSVITWMYLGWIFQKDPLAFIHDPLSSFLGAFFNQGDSRWLLKFGGTLFIPMVVGSLLTVVMAPVLPYLSLSVRHNRLFRRGLLAVAGIPALALGFGTFFYFPAHPVDFLFLVPAAVMAMLFAIPRHRGVNRTVILLLAVGDIVTGALLYFGQTHDIHAWGEALAGEQTNRYLHEYDQLLGRWLDRHREPTLIDDRVGYAAIVARGDAKGLVVPYMTEYKNALKSRVPGISQVVVSSPVHPYSSVDSVRQRFAHAYKQGFPGYRLAYENPFWRVYRIETTK